MEEQSLLDTQIIEYQKQLDAVNQSLQALDTDYQKKKEQGLAILHQLVGAIQALTMYRDAAKEPAEVAPVPDVHDTGMSLEEVLRES
jgi:uncharacterized protein YfkK (UPF0435 family)